MKNFTMKTFTMKNFTMKNFTMKNFTFIAALSLCSFGWVCVSGSDGQLVEVQAGGEVTLLCSNTSLFDSVALWFRVVDRSNASCISVMLNSAPASYCPGFQNGNYKMRTNISTLFLTIKKVDLSDSGLYICGIYTGSFCYTFTVIRLNIEGEPRDDGDSECNACNRTFTLASVIPSVLSVLLAVVIVGLVVRNRKLQTAHEEEPHPEQREDLGSDELNYAAVAFRPKAKRREPEPHVVYAATR
ncbi:uncharacterized protein [Clinocottus analis]|uniref:uncharacterized protein n=1 Tax=Clinocottus analis TaxID=304258 RepID=UPI0035C116F4